MIKVGGVLTVAWMLTWFIGSHMFQFILVDFPSYFGFETSFPVWFVVFITGNAAFLILITVIKKEHLIDEEDSQEIEK